MGTRPVPASTTAPLALLLLVLLACSTRVDQVVTRYRLDLSSPVAGEGAQCWDACMNGGETNEVLLGACLRSCPGVEVASGEGCTVDGRTPAPELCHTRVFEHKALSEESVRSAGLVAGSLTRVAVETGSAVAAHELHDESQSNSSTSTSTVNPPPPSRESRPASPPHEPAKPKVAPSRNHRRQR